MMQSVSNNLKKKIFCDRDAIAKAFEAFDKDGGGSLSYAEFRDGLKSLNLPITISQAKKLFSEFDKSGEGELSTKAFAADVLGVAARSSRGTPCPSFRSRMGSMPSSALSRRSRSTAKGGAPRMPPEFMPPRSKSTLDGRMTRRLLDPLPSARVSALASSRASHTF